MKQIEVIILAGGKGTRMESSKPKALSLLSGKPFLQHILDMLKNQKKFKVEPKIVVGYKKEDIIDCIGDTYVYVVQEQQLGTGHAVKVVESLIEDETLPVVVLYADHPLVSSEAIFSLIKKQEETKAPIVMATTTVPHFENWYHTFLKWGRFMRNDKGDVVSIVEYKDATDDQKEIKEVNPAYSIFDGPWLWENLKMLSDNNAQNEYYLTDLVKIAFKEGYTIPTISIPPEEAIGANSKEELETLETIFKNYKK